MLLAVLKENRECRLYLLRRNSDQACYSNNLFNFLSLNLLNRRDYIDLFIIIRKKFT